VTITGEVTPAGAATIDPTRRRLAIAVWAFLFFCGLAFTKLPMLVPIPSVLGKLATQGAFVVAFVLALALNRDRTVRPSVILGLFTLLAASSLMMSVQMVTGLGMLWRAVRLCGFISVLWLLTPLWVRNNRLLLKWHMGCLAAVIGSVVVGLAIAPGRAFSVQGRLSGQIWPIPPTQVGHYAAVLAGCTAVLWLSGEIGGRVALLMGGSAAAVLLLTHTRTAVIALVIAVLCSMVTLATIRRRVRRVGLALLVLIGLTVTVFAPALSSWYERGQSAQTVGQLNGRKQVWEMLLHAPRSRVDQIFGKGLTNKSFNGLPIDDSWLAIYQDQGIFGVVICAAVILALLLIATTRPRGPCLAVAIFLIVYCAVASATETGLGDVSPYMLDLTVAAALLALPAEQLVQRARR